MHKCLLSSEEVYPILIDPQTEKMWLKRPRYVKMVYQTQILLCLSVNGAKKLGR